jgi:glucan 1,3-beta-glucosidase
VRPYVVPLTPLRQYLAFGDQNNDPLQQQANRACGYASGFRQSMRNFGVTTGGEWSVRATVVSGRAATEGGAQLAINDCSYLLNGVGLGSRYEGTYPSSSRVGSCDSVLDYETCAWS